MGVYAVIMAGGAGTRFWPASRVQRPKQLLPLGQDGKEPLLAAAVRRLSPLISADRVYIATGEHLVKATAETVPEVPRGQLLAEPVPRNTAPCIGWATSIIEQRDPEAIIAVLPSDQCISDEAGFRLVVARALEGAAKGYLTTIGITPTRAETGYGYIEIGDEIDPSLFAVSRFVEKPDRARAEAYVAGKKHLWNAGMFFFRASVMREAIATHLPALAEGLARLGRGDRLGEVFPQLPAISIDHGVMEKASPLAVVKGDFGWSDVGDWQAAWEMAPKDDAGNALCEGAIAIDSRGNLVRDLSGKKRVIALVGVENLVVVDTGDALIVLPRERAQDVRAVVLALKERGDGDLT